MRRVVPLLAVVVSCFAPTNGQCASQVSELSSYEQAAAQRLEKFSRVECPTEDCSLAIGRDDLPLGATLSYERCADDVRKSYVFERGESSWELAGYTAEESVGCPDKSDASQP